MNCNQVMGAFMGVPIVLVCLLALVIGQAEACGRRDLGAFCAKLDKKLAKAGKDPNNSAATFQQAVPHLDSLLNQVNYERSSLAQAWAAVTLDGKCSRDSLLMISMIHDCAPEKLNNLKNTLAKDTRAYVKKCITPQFLEKRLRKDLAGWLPSSPRNVEKFIDKEFILTYRSMNGDEPRIPEVARKPDVIEPVGELDEDSEKPAKGGQSQEQEKQEQELLEVENDNEYIELRGCCHPERSIFPVVHSIVFTSGKEEKELRKSLQKDPSKLVNYLRSHLYKPCEAFIKAIRPLMQTTKEAGQYYEGKQQALFAEQTQEFQDAVFRYEFCQHLRDQSTRERFVKKLEESFGISQSG